MDRHVAALLAMTKEAKERPFVSPLFPFAAHQFFLAAPDQSVNLLLTAWSSLFLSA
jgi:hypothetical protein